ncbi:TonB-dependent receptor domain-containing protein [Lewinella sp. 4G2]|uniref:TonB-dependent receptor n=1 Tax=Lewinella sp. 4G2 TaxID=1803372 RepID=UPI0007B484E6|nr:TonB-dependent receptor [Lewinella sp. 4G2]OAV45024.1 hypothetical protein A3850_011235 [Lewinella sp. 4G2]
MRIFIVALLTITLSTFASGQAYELTVRVTDGSTKTPLEFVNVQIEDAAINGTTDGSGTVVLKTDSKNFTVLASFLGYEQLSQTVRMAGPTQTLELMLVPSAQQIETVTVTSNDASERLSRPVMGVERLNIEAIELIPVALGEVDVFKGLQLISGVNSAGEASNGLSVRGGTIDQNLVLYDGAPVFTPTHLFGLFSVFTPDAIGGVDLYRANIPAKFGGRISSVLDVKSRNPTSDNFKMQGGIGIVSSHLSIETPVDKQKKVKVLAAVRGGFNDFIFKQIDRLKNTESRFADATVKLRYTANEKNIFTVSGFYSADFYQIDLLNQFSGITSDRNQYTYSTLNGTAEWLKIFNDRASLNTQLVRSDHKPRLLFPQADTDNVIEFDSRIQYHSAQSIFSYNTENGHRLSGGGQLIRYDIDPGGLDPDGVESILPVNLDTEQSLEASLFVEDEWKVSDALTLSAGLRFTQYAQLGPGTNRIYDNEEILDPDRLTETEEFGSGENMQTYNGFEPRLGLSYQLSPKLSFKAAYALNRQYLQNIFNSTTPLPSSRWKLSDNNILPQKATLYSSGFYWLPGDKGYELSLEGYYRDIDNLLEYKPGADFFLNPTVETDLIQGQGVAYGIEAGIKRRKGNFTGEINYAYARSLNTVDGPTFNTSVNAGQQYNGYFDQPHTFNLNLTLDDQKANQISLNFVVQSNRPYTVPNGVLQIGETPVPLFLERNNARLPVYHRLDFSWRIHNAKLEEKRWVGDWIFTVYNLYGRKNAYNIYYQPRTSGAATAETSGSPLESFRLTIFGAPVISLGYSFKFQ